MRVWNRWCIVGLVSAVAGLGTVANAAEDVLFISDAIEGKVVGVPPNDAGVKVGAPATSASWSVAENAPVDPGDLIFVEAGSQVDGEGANAQTLHIVQPDTENPPSIVAVYLDSDVPLKATDVAAGASITFRFSVKWNAIPDPDVQGMNIALWGDKQLGSLIRFLPGKYCLVSGPQALFRPDDPAGKLVTGKWYQFVQNIDLEAQQFTTHVKVLNEDGSVFATGTNSTPVGFSQSPTQIDRIRFDVNTRAVDVEINDISITYTPASESEVQGRTSSDGSLDQGH